MAAFRMGDRFPFAPSAATDQLDPHLGTPRRRLLVTTARCTWVTCRLRVRRPSSKAFSETLDSTTCDGFTCRRIKMDELAVSASSAWRQRIPPGARSMRWLKSPCRGGGYRSASRERVAKVGHLVPLGEVLGRGLLVRLRGRVLPDLLARGGEADRRMLPRRSATTTPRTASGHPPHQLLATNRGVQLAGKRRKKRSAKAVSVVMSRGDPSANAATAAGILLARVTTWTTGTTIPEPTHRSAARKVSLGMVRPVGLCLGRSAPRGVVPTSPPTRVQIARRLSTVLSRASARCLALPPARVAEFPRIR